MRHGELQGGPEVSGRGEDRTSAVRDVQPAVPGTGNAVGEAEGRRRADMRQQRQDVPVLVSHVRGRVRHRPGDRDQVGGKVSPARRRRDEYVVPSSPTAVYILPVAFVRVPVDIARRFDTPRRVKRSTVATQIQVVQVLVAGPRKHVSRANVQLRPGR